MFLKTAFNAWGCFLSKGRNSFGYPREQFVTALHADSVVKEEQDFHPKHQ
jgi:hypothetical protein